jgi:L-seryl-tRNA(Ser) seleniumtransferase
MEAMPQDPRRSLPPVDRLLREPILERLAGLYGRERVRAQARHELAAARRELASGGAGAQAGVLAGRIAAAVETRLGAPPRRVLNATGVLLHTNLGRAPLPRSVAEALPALLTAACDLELDLATGRRDSRTRRVAALLCEATGAEAATVVNNNAAALALALAALARDREVVVSRGELVEIGGSFRIPEILAAAGAVLVEVGTTNRTRRADYERAIGERTAALLKVIPSNYRIRGFTEAVAVPELVQLAAERGLPVVVDEGSGLLRPHPAPQLADHPSLAQLVAWGVDLACGSGDKLLGGPQAGLLVGKRSWIELCRAHPLCRALRPDRFTLAALDSVVRMHLAGARLPLDRMWAAEEVDPRLEAAAAALGAAILPADAFLGGGSAPEEPLPGRALALPDDGDLLARLRLGEPPVVGYARDGKVFLDLRTVDPADDTVLLEAVRRAMGVRGQEPRAAPRAPRAEG